MAEEQISVAVIGAGQAGLATSYHLHRRRVFHTVFEAGSHPGSHWRRRWDSLRLHTPTQLSGLPGLALGHANLGPPTKDEIADYLIDYAQRFGLPIQTRRRVLRVEPNPRRGFVVTVSNELDGTVDVVHATAVVWAAGAHAAAAVPWYADRLPSAIQQLTAASYRNPAQVSGGPVLVVGAGNSGAEIALEVARSRPTFKVLLSGRDVGTETPLDSNRFLVRQLLRRAGLRLHHRVPGHGDPWVRVRRHDLVAAGVEQVAKVAGVKNGWPRLVTDDIIPCATVIWCTGLRPDPAIDGVPLDLLQSADRHGGTPMPGFYAVGLPARSGLNSHLLAGVGADAERTVSHLITHTLYT